MKKKKKKSSLELTIFDPSDAFDEEERATKLSSLNVSSHVNPKECLSTGILSLDLSIGGGLQLGRAYETVGPEQGGKTTIMYSAFGQAVKYIPNPVKGIMIDADGKIDPKWFKNICKVKNIKALFGVRNSDGNWAIKPTLRYYKPQYGEQALKLIKRVLRRMPDKILIKDIWYHVWSPKTPKAVKKAGGYTHTDLVKMLKKTYDKDLFKKTGNFYVPIPNNYAGPEIIIGIDSWASMIPESSSEDNSDALGAPARMFAKYLTDIRGLISNKGAVLLGTNQIRERPMAFGDPEYNPGGNTLRHIIDVRIRVQGVSHAGKAVEVEGNDEYRHYKTKVKKNKTFIPYKESSGRWWIGHKGVSGYGNDKVLDTLEYLRMTGQLKKSKQAIAIKMIGKNPEYKKLAKQKISYEKFKDMILNPDKGIDVRRLCEKQLKSGKGMKLYMKQVTVQQNQEKEKEQDDE